jgi:hypothetical protein
MRGQRVYFEASRGPYAAGEKSFIGQTLTRLHLRNVVDARQGPFPRLNPEYVVKLDPDILMAGERAWKTGVPEYPGWAQMRAVKQGAICAFTPEQSDILVRPGPRMAEGRRSSSSVCSVWRRGRARAHEGLHLQSSPQGQRGLAAAWLLLWLTLAAALLALLGAGIGSTGFESVLMPGMTRWPGRS